MTITPYLLITYRMINKRKPFTNRLSPKRDPRTGTMSECLLLSFRLSTKVNKILYKIYPTV